jgi:hypothetical protein
MFWQKKPGKEEEKRLSGPKDIPGLVQNYLVAEKKMDPGLVKLFKASRGPFLFLSSKSKIL